MNLIDVDRTLSTLLLLLKKSDVSDTKKVEITVDKITEVIYAVKQLMHNPMEVSTAKDSFGISHEDTVKLFDHVYESLSKQPIGLLYANYDDEGMENVEDYLRQTVASALVRLAVENSMTPLSNWVHISGGTNE